MTKKLTCYEMSHGVAGLKRLFGMNESLNEGVETGHGNSNLELEGLLWVRLTRNISVRTSKV
jgi:hypothetical protein